MRLNVPLPSTKSQYWSGSGGTFPAERWFSAPKMGWLLPSPSRTNWKPSILGAERRRRMWCRRWRWPFDLDAGRRPGRIASHVAIVTFFSLIRGLTESKKGAYLSWANGADFTQNSEAAVWVQCTTVPMITFLFPRGGYRRLAETTFLAEYPISNYTV